MPSGAELRLAFLIGPDEAPARLEIMSFKGVPTTERSTAGHRHQADRLRRR